MTRTELVRRRRQMHRRIRQVVAERRMSITLVARPAGRDAAAEQDQAAE